MRLVEIPDDGIVSEYIWAGDNVVGIRRMDLSYLPTIKAEPVRHGRWIEKPFLLGTSNYCSLCDSFYGMPHGKFNYCPNCGAKMDGGANE